MCVLTALAMSERIFALSAGVKRSFSAARMAVFMLLAMGATLLHSIEQL